LLVNLPFMLLNFDAWLFPYLWQTTREPTRDGACYLIYYVLGDTAASLFFPILYASTILWLKLYVARHGKETNVKTSPSNMAKVAGISVPLLASFLIANRIFSPQYILWMLPFLVFASTSPIPFYLFEIPNVAHTIFLFKYMADYPLLSYALRALRYLALLSIYLHTLLSGGMKERV